MSKSVERTITVDRPLSAVWSYLSDFTTTTEWDPGTVRTIRESGDGGVGTTYLNTSKVASREVGLVYVVQEFEPERTLTLHGENDTLETLDRITFDGDETRTTVTYAATFTPKGAAKLLEPLLPLGLKKLADATEDSLAEHLERI